MEKQHTRPDKTFLCRVVIIDGLGNAFLYDNTIPYTIGFKEFLGRLQVDAFRPLLKIHDELDYASWAKRLSFLSSDEAAIAKLEVLIDQHKNTNYDNLAEWLWICADGSGDSGGKLIADEKEFQAFMALAKSKRLGKGCLMRVSLLTTFSHLDLFQLHNHTTCILLNHISEVLTYFIS